MENMMRVLIVEDDFRVAEINRHLVNKVEGFHVVGLAKTGAETLAFLQDSDERPHLIILDVYIPDSDRLSLFWAIRKNYPHIDIIMLSAAKEVATIEETLRGGIFDYIVKPVNFVRFERTLERYSEQRMLLSSKKELEQDDIDRLTGLQTATPIHSSSSKVLPKGIDPITLGKIKNILEKNLTSGVNALDTGKMVGVSRSTARRYLEYLVSVQEAEAQLNYGEIGRPERKYNAWTK